MSERTKAEDHLDELRRAFQRGICEVLTGTPPAHAFQAADKLCEIWKELLAGCVVSMPALPRYNTDAITADWHVGLSIDQIVEKHQCSRKTAYRYHPAKVVSRIA